MFNLVKHPPPSSSSSSAASSSSSGPEYFVDCSGNNHLLLAGFKQLVGTSQDSIGLTDMIVDFFARVGELDATDSALNARLTDHMCQLCFNLVSEAANA
jgi:hypothetical protein